MDVTSKLDRLKSEIEKYEEQLIGIRKLKREAANKNLPDQEGPTEEEGVGRKIQA
jgi:hypothetical protein